MYKVSSELGDLKIELGTFFIKFVLYLLIIGGYIVKI